DNAVKYSPHCPMVWVEWAAEGERIAIRVRDRGLGIPPAEREQIFQKFVRGAAATEANVKGTGVGLAMVRHVVTAHGGDIKVESEPGAGRTFTMLLPKANRVMTHEGSVRRGFFGGAAPHRARAGPLAACSAKECPSKGRPGGRPRSGGAAPPNLNR